MEFKNRKFLFNKEFDLNLLLLEFVPISLYIFKKQDFLLYPIRYQHISVSKAFVFLMKLAIVFGGTHPTSPKEIPYPL